MPEHLVPKRLPGPFLSPGKLRVVHVRATCPSWLEQVVRSPQRVLLARRARTRNHQRNLMSKPGGLLRTLSPKRSLEEPLDPSTASPDLNKSSSNKRWNFKRQKSIVELPDPTDETAFKADWGITLKQEVTECLIAVSRASMTQGPQSEDTDLQEQLLAQFTEELKAEKLVQPEKGVSMHTAGLGTSAMAPLESSARCEPALGAFNSSSLQAQHQCNLP